MELTETGRVVLSYAEELFQVSAELEEILRGGKDERVFPFRVGVADVVPKSIAHRLLAPALALPEPLRLVCREDRLDRLLAKLAIHRLDMVLADRPMPPGMDVKGYSHPLGECSVAFFATPDLAGRLTGGFPDSSARPCSSPARTAPCAPRSPAGWSARACGHASSASSTTAPIKAFGKAGAGSFRAAATGQETEGQYGVIRLGETSELRERFFAISVERRLTHPAVRAVSEGARAGLFAGDGT